MKGGYIIVSCLFTSLIYGVDSIEPVTTVIGVGTVTVALVSYAGMVIKCRVSECCYTNWLHQQVPNLRASLNAHVYGQHLVVQTVPGAIKGHLTHPPKKALVMSFQGTTGTGKNLVARVVAENMYRKGMDSKYVHVISATKHFSRHELVKDYQDDLRKWVVGNITECENQLFIFDEIEKLPTGLLDALKPFVDYYDKVEGLDYRKAVYLFLGNAGGNRIREFSQEVYQSGKPRESMKLHNMEHAAWTLASEEKGGLKGSALIESNLIDFFVPFLPLEKNHVRECIKDDLDGKNFTLASRNSQKYTKVVNSVMKHIRFIPDSQPLYSDSGCKKINQYVNLVLEELED